MHVDEREHRASAEPDPRTPVGVVIPAHDEASTLGATLDALLADAEPGCLDVVVVANACHDDTAAVARSRGVRVIVTDVPGKAHALRLGDATLKTFPRVYLDADVRLGAGGVSRLAEALVRSGALACSPEPEWDEARVGPFARRVHRVHELLVAPRRALAGAGVYVLTRRGHARVFPLPDVISDDGWVHRHFAQHERLVVRDVRSIMQPAPSVLANLRRRTRLRRGNDQLVALGLTSEGRLTPGALRELLAGGRVAIFDVAVYVLVVMADRAATLLSSRSRSDREWSTDRPA